MATVPGFFWRASTGRRGERIVGTTGIQGGMEKGQRMGRRRTQERWCASMEVVRIISIAGKTAVDL